MEGFKKREDVESAEDSWNQRLEKLRASPGFTEKNPHERAVAELETYMKWAMDNGKITKEDIEETVERAAER